jgi:hypothetical protein
MKKILLLSALFFVFLKVEAQVQKMAVIEEFTNASCPPCASQNPAFNALLEQNLDKVIPIKYQTAFPGFDPYNQQNPGEVSTRFSVYPEITGVPTAAIDGVIPGNNYGGGGLSTWTSASGGYNGGPYGYNQAVLNYAASQVTPLAIGITAEYNADLTSATVRVNLTNTDSVALGGNQVLHVLLLEKENVWPNPPGSTNEVDFTFVMRKMYPNANGTAVGVIEGNAELSYEFEAAIPAYIYDLSQMVFVAFVQTQGTRAIVNGAITDLVEVPDTFSDVEISGVNTLADDALCGRSLTGSITVRNSGNTLVTSFTATLRVGTDAYSQEFQGSLAPGESTVIEFDEVVLSGGTNSVSYEITNLNGSPQRQINLLNTLTPRASFPAIGSEVVASFSVTYEGAPNGVNLPGMINQAPGTFVQVVNQSFFNAPNPIGGYGQSEKSLWVNFYQWNPGSSPARGSIINANLLDIANKNEIVITFDRAHAQYDQPVTSDRLQGYVSYNCGETWQLVYNKAGNALATVPPVNPFYLPAPNHWATDSIFINNDQGVNELLFKFDVISDWGNSLFIDNINAEALSTSTQQRPTLMADVFLAPNPASSETVLNIIMEEQANLEVALYNSLGQKVMDLGRFNFAIGEYNVNFSVAHLPGGMYHLVLQDGKKISTHKLMVAK